MTKPKQKAFNIRQQKRVVKRTLHQKAMHKEMRALGGRLSLWWFIRNFKLGADIKKHMKKTKKLLKKYQVIDALLQAAQNGKTD